MLQQQQQQQQQSPIHPSQQPIDGYYNDID